MARGRLIGQVAFALGAKVCVKSSPSALGGGCDAARDLESKSFWVSVSKSEGHNGGTNLMKAVGLNELMHIQSPAGKPLPTAGLCPNTGECPEGWESL